MFWDEPALLEDLINLKKKSGYFLSVQIAAKQNINRQGIQSNTGTLKRW